MMSKSFADKTDLSGENVVVEGREKVELVSNPDTLKSCEQHKGAKSAEEAVV